MPLCDFHIHSTFSDGELSISQIVDMYGQQGFGAIAITDHLCETYGVLGFSAKVLGKTLDRNNFREYLLEIKIQGQRALEQYGMQVIPGVEFTKNSFRHQDSAHIVGLGIQGFIDPNLEIEQICKQVRMQGGVTVAAHPVSTGKFEPQTYFLWNNRFQLQEHFDAWEIASGPSIFKQVAETHLPVIANSDLHKARQFQSWKTLVKDTRHIESIFKQIKQQQLEIQFY